MVTVERRPYLDVRTLVSLVSGKYQVDATRGRASLRVDQKTVDLHAGASTARLADRAVPLSSPPRVMGRRFLAPMDLLPLVLAERYGQEMVDWVPERRLARVRSREATINRIRAGVYPTHTRVVLETVRPLEWSIQRGGTGVALRVMVPGGVLGKGIQPLALRTGPVRAIEPTQLPGGAEIRIIGKASQAAIRTFTLAHPDRIVIDVLAAPPPKPEKTAARDGANSPSDPSRPLGQSPSPGEADAAAPPTEGAGRTADASREAVPPGALRKQGTHQRVPVLAGEGLTAPGRGGEVLTVVLDPGHGGHDTGAVGPTGLMEKDVVLDLALRLRRLLTERLGMRVIMTRTEDLFVPLQERTAIANRAKADFFLSLHMNGAAKRGAGGFETFYFTREPSDSDARTSAQRENLVIESNGTAGKDLESLLKITLADMAVTRDMRESSELAELVLASLGKLLKVENRGVKSGPFYVLATAAMPAILVESAFITNPREERKLQQEAYRQRVAEALYEGIAKYKVRHERRVGMGSSAAAAAGS